MKLHTGDSVTIITGKDKGKTGRILRILADKNRVVVAGINMRTRHMKKTAQQAGQRIRYEGSIHASNVMIIDPKTKKPSRIGMRFRKDGGKERFSKKSGESLASGRALRKLVEDEVKKVTKKSDTEENSSEAAPKKKTTKKASPSSKK